nr:hypothetical protein [Tanacetum cinerariifolium]
RWRIQPAFAHLRQTARRNAVHGDPGGISGAVAPPQRAERSAHRRADCRAFASGGGRPDRFLCQHPGAAR